MCFCVRSLSTSFCTALGVTTSSASPWMMMPEDGQGARKVKSYMLAGGATEMKPRISGRRIRSCIPIHAPKLTPAIHVVCASRSEEHTSELQSLMRISYAVFCLKKKTQQNIKARKEL